MKGLVGYIEFGEGNLPQFVSRFGVRNIDKRKLSRWLYSI